MVWPSCSKNDSEVTAVVVVHMTRFSNGWHEVG